MATSGGKASGKAARFWMRLGQWYGARIASEYGEEIPPEWREVVERASESDLKLALTILRTKCVDHPPTLPQLEQALRRPSVAKSHADETLQEQLTAYVMRTLGIAGFGGKLSERQVRGQWLWAYRKAQWIDPMRRQREEPAEVVAVTIPEDGPGFPARRITVEEMLTGQEALQAGV